MAKTVTTVSTEGFSSENQIRDFDLTIDATGEQSADTLEVLLATYASCFVPALRVGAEQRDAGELGEIEIEAHGEQNDDDKLSSVRFAVSTEADLDADAADAVVERAEELCKVHDALKPELHAQIDV